MKLPILAVVAFFSAGTKAECEFCTGGLTVASDTDVPNTGGDTCGSLLESAPTFDADEYFCTDVTKNAEDICCPVTVTATTVTATTVAVTTVVTEEVEEQVVTPSPSPETTDVTSCTVCSNGITVAADVSLGPGRSCGGLMVDALTVEDDSDECDDMKGTEETCCPAPLENPCSLCANGLTVDAEDVDVGRGDTCGSLVTYALTVENDSNECDDMKETEETCCPAPIVDPCSFCANGLAVDAEDVNLGRGDTCGSFMTDALAFEDDSDECSEIKDSQETCCPAPAENPCSICAEGLTVEEGVDVGGGGTCGSLMTEALIIEDDSEECDQMKGAEDICCSALAAEPCSVCPDGITVEEDVAVMEGQTCGDLLVDALGIEESSDECSAMKGSEQTCCPPEELVDEPCSVCSQGLTVDESVDLGAGRTCGGLLVDALSAEEGSDQCTDMKGAEVFCCPTLAEEPCSVCSGGLAVDGSVELGGGRTCGGLVEDALNVEEDSGDCDAMKGAEATCCPPGMSAVPTATPETNSTETSAPQASLPETSSPQASVPETSSPQASLPETSSPQASLSSAPTPGKSISTSAPVVAIIESSAPTPATVGTDTSSPVATTKTSSPTTASPVVDIAFSGSLPTYSPTTGPTVKQTESPNASKEGGEPAFEEATAPAQPSESTSLVASGFLTFVVTSLFSTVYAIALM